MAMIPWIILGGILPLVTGGFTTQWNIRVIVIGIVMLIVKFVFAYMWVWSYNIPEMRAFIVVVIGVIGIALSAAAPSILGWIVKMVKENLAYNF